MCRKIFPVKPLLLLFWMLGFTATLQAQYFGRNKVLYQNFDFKVNTTPHFDIYTYLKNDAQKATLAQRSEQWYLMHQQVLRDTFRERNPLIIYNHHAHFQQTRAIGGEIGVGTGGVTEGLKNRVIMPFMESNAQTDHVLGHELVHAFQYHLVKDSISLNALSNLPLWMVEGMAEYMSIGYTDAHTALWLRSAVQENKLPTLKDLTNRPDLYFPYRWGQAFWAFTTAVYGDEVIKRLFMETARSGYSRAIKLVTGLDEKQFSERWQQATRTAYAPYQQGVVAPPGQSLVNKQKAGELNIVPSISPDGKHIAYWTEKNLFSLDLYVADAATGGNAKRITRHSFNTHVDQYSSYESSVAWSPDSRQLAIVVFAKGRNQLVIADVNGKIRQQLDIPGIDGFNNPTWSPDGSTIVVTGLVEGQSDLYAFNLSTRAVRQLTNDRYSDLQPSYAADGKSLVFSTDRLSLGNNRLQHRFAHNIAVLDLASGAVTNLDLFPGANNLNPVYGRDGDIYFLSDRDGLRNLYVWDAASKTVSQLTQLFTGITGITMWAPAISISRQTDQLVYSYYANTDYTIYSTPAASLARIPVGATAVNMQAGQLPPFARGGRDIVQNNLATPPALTTAQATPVEKPYEPRFGLDYLGNTGVGLQVGGPLGGGLAGGINGIFSDILGDNQLFGALSLNGQLIDVGGQFAYLNQKKRINWGASLSHIPYLSGAQYLFYDTITNRNGDSVEVLNSSLDLLRTFQDQVSLFASYPFSPIRRVEAGASFARYYYRMDRYTDYYDPSGSYYIGNAKEKLPTPRGFNFGNAYVALVGDNSFFGVASPLGGHRFRFEAGQYMGVVQLQNITADYRRYFRLAPVTLATRNLFVGRYGKDAESGVLPPLFIGYSTLVRGYDALEYADEGNGLPLTINDLIGSRIYVGNAEVRLPFTGPERLSVIKSRILFSELNLFTDAGLAWGNNTPLFSDVKGGGNVQRTSRLIMSTGLSLRVNLFGYLILEPYYAIPWQNGGLKNGTFGFNFTPGW